MQNQNANEVRRVRFRSPVEENRVPERAPSPVERSSSPESDEESVCPCREEFRILRATEVHIMYRKDEAEELIQELENMRRSYNTDRVRAENLLENSYNSMKLKAEREANVREEHSRLKLGICIGIPAFTRRPEE